MSIEELYKIYKKHSSVSTDSRRVGEGDLFFALKGPNFDGNAYADDAIAKGAAYVVISDPAYQKGGQYIVVNDTLVALQQLARHHRRQLDIPFIAIAGSNGKTTTKELTRAILAESMEAFATPGNFNNEIGVPLSILRIKPDCEAAVIEMGARHVGEVMELCEIAEPDYGLITNVGKDHLETFKTLENTIRTNAELYQYLAQNGGTVFVHRAHQYLMEQLKDDQQIITYGTSELVDFRGRVESNFPFLEVSYFTNEEWEPIQSQLVGKYNLENIMAAIAIGKTLRVPDMLIKKAIAGYKPSNNRSQLVVTDTNQYILDAYNANPSSMSEALDNFESIEGNYKVVMLGDMLELGDVSFEEHLLVALKLKSMNLFKIVLVGEEFGKVKDRLDCEYFLTSEEARLWFDEQKFIDTKFLLKGSRGIALEQIVKNSLP